MSLLNTEELKRQSKEGPLTSLDDIINEFQSDTQRSDSDSFTRRVN